jgi:hypothetical protein
MACCIASKLTGTILNRRLHTQSALARGLRIRILMPNFGKTDMHRRLSTLEIGISTAGTGIMSFGPSTGRLALFVAWAASQTGGVHLGPGDRFEFREDGDGSLVVVVVVVDDELHGPDVALAEICPCPQHLFCAASQKNSARF